ncbi:MAG: HAMP domain-containing protein, partial [Actinomycetota bacterium]|nr:HAMP domain-containing protein [Actinomycetota bacterium]
MRRRITLTMVGVVTAAVLVATLGTIVLLRVAARADTRSELGRQAADMASRLDEIQRPGVLTALGGVLRLEDQRIVCLGAACRVASEPPPGITRADLDVDRLRTGATITGTKGSLVFAAAGIPRSPDMLLVVVLTRRVHTRPPGGLWILAVAAATLAVAAAVAADLGRRLTRPLREAQGATRRIAAGDLATRVPINPADGEELAGLAESINTMAASLERSRGLERQ